MFSSSVFQISAQDMADQLIGVTSVSTFGFSLAGQVDVDANEYNGRSLLYKRSNECTQGWSEFSLGGVCFL